jgi:hypothetical protein
MPVETGIEVPFKSALIILLLMGILASKCFWIPACAGMTDASQ